MMFSQGATNALYAFLLAGALASPPVAQVPARSTYYSVPSWAPDGNTITFESNRDGEAAVYSIRPDGSNLRRLTPAGTRGEQPNWSADGRFLVYSSAKDGVKQLHRMTPDGRNVETLPGTTNGFLAAFSPDGRWLLFAAQDRIPSNQYRVYVTRQDGSDRRSLGDMAKSNEDPRWTTDGARVVFTEVPLLEMLPNEAPRDFVRRRTQAQRLVSVTPDGRETRALEPEEASRLTRDRGLSPDGKWLVFAKAVDGVSGLFLRDQASGTERLLDGGMRAAVSMLGQSPAPMYSVGATFDSDRNVLVLFGGYGGTYSGDTWTWQGTQWSRLPAAGPSARNGPQLAYDQQRRQVVMFGGDTRATGALGDTWVLDDTGWRQVASDGPPARSGHTLAYDSRRGLVVMFGGNAGGRMFGDTWEWDGARWAEVATTGPSARSLHAMAYDSARGKVVLFGGTPVFSSDAPSFGGTWEWDGKVWSQVDAVGPTPRDHIFMAFDPVRRMTVLHGGGNGASSSETWGFDGTSWTALSREGPPRRYAPMVFDNRTGRILLYGGFDRSPSNELWEFASTGWRKIVLVVATVAGGAPAPPQSAQPPSAIQEVNDRFVREWSEQLGDRVTQPAGQVFKNITLAWLTTVPAGTLLNIMDVGYSKALGVRCTYCHAADDFASDAKRPKQAAREMAIMHRDINQRLARMKYLTDAPEDRLIICATCHQGSTKPINRTP